MADHHIDLGYKPREWQKRIHLSKKRFIIAVCHRRSGKTVSAKMEMLDRCLTKGKTECAYIAPFLSQARRIMWSPIKELAHKIPHTDIRETEMLVTFANGSTIRCLGADNADGIRGLGFDYVVGDELADWDPDVLPLVVFPTLAGRNGALTLLGTPKGIDPLTEMFDRHKNDPDWDCFKFNIDQTGVFSDEEIRTMKANLLPRQFNLEFMVDFDAGAEDQLIPGDLVEASFNRKIDPMDYYMDPIVLGVDLARSGADNCVIFKRQGIKAWKLREWHAEDTMASVDIIADEIRKHEPDATFMDIGGVGAGVYDRLKQIGYDVTDIQFGGASSDPRWLNKRAEMYMRLLNWLNGGGALDRDPVLKADLTCFKYMPSDKGATKLESKEDLKKRGMPSPDRGDALALTFAHPVYAMRDKFGDLINRKAGRTADTPKDAFWD